MNKALFEVIGAVVVATVILGIPVLSFVSFVNEWHLFFRYVLTVGLFVDFLCVSSMLMGETE